MSPNLALVLTVWSFVVTVALYLLWPRTHHYTSTACFHGRHSSCQYHCKYCRTRCRCHCHWKEEYVQP